MGQSVAQRGINVNTNDSCCHGQDHNGRSASDERVQRTVTCSGHRPTQSKYRASEISRLIVWSLVFDVDDVAFDASNA
jgi:hypothetical protein